MAWRSTSVRGFLWFMNLFSMVSKRACWLRGGEIVCDNCCGIVLMYMLIR